MGIKLTKRVSGIAESATLAISAKAKKMKADGRDVVNFGVGEPDFNTPDYIINAAVKAMKEGRTKYTPASGIAELKQAVAEDTERSLGIRFLPEQVVIGAGAKQPLYNAIAAIAEEGDEVIVPSPYWVTYPELVKYCGAKCVFVETKPENGYKMTADELANAITPRTRALIFNSPCNPTGAVYSEEEVMAIAKVLGEHENIAIISDEIYKNLVYGENGHYSVAMVNEDMKNRTIIVDGMSKTYAMTGWRLGWAIAPVEIAKVMTRAQSHMTSNVNSIAQYASLAALTDRANAEKFISEMKGVFAERRIAAMNALDEEGLNYIKPDGAFYVLVDVSPVFGRKTRSGNVVNDSADFANELLTDYGVAVVPGSAFGADDYVRISYALDASSIKKGIRKLGEFVKECR